MKAKCRICNEECQERRGHWNKLCCQCLPIWDQQWRLLKIPEDRRVALQWNEVEKYRPKSWELKYSGWASTTEVLKKKYRHEVDVLVIIKKVKRYDNVQN